MDRFRVYIILLYMVITAGKTTAQQLADTSFRFDIPLPAYKAGSGPVIIFDEFHNNPFTLKGQYSPFNKLLTQDGYVLRPSREPISPEALQNARIYVSVNALADPMNWDLPNRPAFTPEEADYIYEWVNDGGSLFLVIDHMPCPASANIIAMKFGFNAVNGFAIKKKRGAEIFSRLGGSLYSSTITDAPGARIDSIRIWGGTGFIAPKNAEVISALDDSYDIYLPERAGEIQGLVSERIPKISGLGFVNGAALRLGKGRVVIFADGAPFSAQLSGIKSEKRGMNHPDARQNAQFLLNIIHWLNGKL